MAWLTVRGSARRVRCGKLVCLARTYPEHAAEMGTAPPAEPVLFLKPPSAVVHDGGTVLLPARSSEVQHEVELGVVLGRTCSRVEEGEALRHVLGYLVGLDVTARDLQREARRAGMPWALAKGFDTFAPLSEVVPRGDVSDPNDLELELRVNGEVRQWGSTGRMLFSVERILAFVSRAMTLERGDVVLTGTPEGVGPLAEGDVVEARLGGLARLRVDVRQGP